MLLSIRAGGDDVPASGGIVLLGEDSRIMLAEPHRLITLLEISSVRQRLVAGSKIFVKLAKAHREFMREPADSVMNFSYVNK